MFDLEAAETEDLSQGPSRASGEGSHNLFDHRWVWMAVFVFVIGALVRNSALMAISAFMLVIIATALYWSRHALDHVGYRRRFRYRRVFPGEALDVHIVAENANWLPVLWLQIEDEWPVDFAPEEQASLAPSSGLSKGYLVNVYALRWHERVRRRYTLLASRRGLYPLGPATLLSGDPFGLFEREATTPKGELLIVYPDIRPLEEFGLDAKDPFGDVRVQRRLFEDPQRVMGVRGYRSTDSFRHIHWQATARTGNLQVRQYEPTRSQSLVLALNMVSFTEYKHGIWPEMVEYLVSLAASLASWAVEKEYAVGLMANAAFSQTDRPLRTQPGRRHDQLPTLLEAMAGISNFITADYAQFLLDESARMPWNTTIAALTAYTSDDILAALMRLRQSGRRVVLYVLGSRPPPDLPGMSGILVYHLPIVDKPTVQPIRLAGDAGETPRDRYLRDKRDGS